MHTQRVLSAEGVLCAHTRYTHRRGECCVWRGCCVHTQRVLSAEGVLCAYTRYTHNRKERCEWRCGVGVVCIHKVHTTERVL